MCVLSASRYTEEGNQDGNQPRELSQTHVFFLSTGNPLAFGNSFYSQNSWMFISQATEGERQSIKIVQEATIPRCINRNDEVDVCSGSIHHGGKQSYPPSQGSSEHSLLFIMKTPSPYDKVKSYCLLW